MFDGPKLNTISMKFKEKKIQKGKLLSFGEHGNFTDCRHGIEECVVQFPFILTENLESYEFYAAQYWTSELLVKNNF
jgi:hypothetical protein